MTALDNSTQDIDSLLAEADSLMNDMAGNLGAPPAPPPDAKLPPSTSTGQDDRATISQLADGLTAAVEAADHDAIVERLDAEHSDTTQATNSETAGDAPKQATKAAAAGPKSAPEDWVAEANLTEDTGADVPSIPETSKPGDPVSPGAAQESETPAGPRGVSRCVRHVFRLPIYLLIVLDLPFSWMNMTMKSCIGYAAIATLMTAAGTAVVGTMLRKH